MGDVTEQNEQQHGEGAAKERVRAYYVSDDEWRNKVWTDIREGDRVRLTVEGVVEPSSITGHMVIQDDSGCPSVHLGSILDIATSCRIIERAKPAPLWPELEAEDGSVGIIYNIEGRLWHALKRQKGKWVSTETGAGVPDAMLAIYARRGDFVVVPAKKGGGK